MLFGSYGIDVNFIGKAKQHYDHPFLFARLNKITAAKNLYLEANRKIG